MEMNGTTTQSLDAQDSKSITDILIIEDKQLRNSLITASLKLETMIQEGKALVGGRIITKSKWGLETEIETSQPKENKPIIFKYTYSINMVTLKNWMEEHKYLMEQNLAFTSRGILFVIPGPGIEKVHKLMAEFVVRYTPEEREDRQLLQATDIAKEPMQFMVHRDIVSNNDWMIQYVIPG